MAEVQSGRPVFEFTSGSFDTIDEARDNGCEFDEISINGRVLVLPRGPVVVGLTQREAVHRHDRSKSFQEHVQSP